MSDNKHMREFTATPTVEELEAEIERLQGEVAIRGEVISQMDEENAKQKAEIERLTHRDIARGDTVMSLLEARLRLWAENDKLQAVVDAVTKVTDRAAHDRSYDGNLIEDIRAALEADDE